MVPSSFEVFQSWLKRQVLWARFQQTLGYKGENALKRSPSRYFGWKASEIVAENPKHLEGIRLLICVDIPG
jgi:hypothetical protein